MPRAKYTFQRSSARSEIHFKYWFGNWLSPYSNCRNDIPKTNFHMRYGHFEFLVMPFGLTTFTISLAQFLKGYICIYIIFITFGHWSCVNMTKWPKSYLWRINGPKTSHKEIGTFGGLGLISIFLHSFSTFSLLTQQPTTLVFWT